MIKKFSTIFNISKYTFIEIYKSKIMVSLLFTGLALMLISFVASEFTYGVPNKVALDFGLGILSISSLTIAIFMGSQLVSKEIENRTIYMVLSRPVNRWVFLLGRVFGMGGILFLNMLIQGLMTLFVLRMLGGEVTYLYTWGLLFIFLESFLVLNIVILLSMISNNAISIMFTLVIFITGHAVENLEGLFFVTNNSLFKGILAVYKNIFPVFSKFSIKDYILYESRIPDAYLSSSLLYGVFYLMIIFAISSSLFRSRNLD